MFYDRFKRLCFEKGVSEMKAATDIGLSTSTTWKWRTGATPRFETLKKLAAYFDVSPEYFLENGDDKGNQITDSQIASGNIGTVTMTDDARPDDKIIDLTKIQKAIGSDFTHTYWELEPEARRNFWHEIISQIVLSPTERKIERIVFRT